MIKEQYPFIEENGNPRHDLVKHWAEDENGVQYLMVQNETGVMYAEAIDIYPCPYTYSQTDIKVGEEEETEETEQE